MRWWRLLACVWLGLWVGLAAAIRPAAATEPVSARRHMIVAADRRAAQAGLDVLRAGGTAVDAAIAAQPVLAVVEPQSSGLGGGAVMLHLQAATGTVTAWDGRETAPAAAGPDLFLSADGRPLEFYTAGVGGRAVGVPGTIAMLEAAHRASGQLPWDRLFAAAIRLAEDGFAVSPRLAASIAADAPHLSSRAATRALFFQHETAPLPAGALLVNRAAGRDAEGGGRGRSRRAAARPDGGGDRDGRAHRRQSRPAHRRRPRRLCAEAPRARLRPLSRLSRLRHGPALVRRPHRVADPGTARAFRHGLAEAVRRRPRCRSRAPARRGRPTRLRRPRALPRRYRLRGGAVRGLLSPDYLTARAQLIDPDHAIATPRAGNPSWEVPNLAPAPMQAEHGTSHLAVVDDAGDAVALTTTVQDAFGARLLVRGFLLNNELTDFSFLPSRDGRPSPTGWSPASGRAARWRRPWCSTRRAGCVSSSDRSAARASSRTWPRRWWR